MSTFEAGDFEVCGSGSCEGAGTRAEYVWTERGWFVEYFVEGGERLGDSRGVGHPSLGLLQLEQEAAMIDIVTAWLELLDFGDEATAQAFAPHVAV